MAPSTLTLHPHTTSLTLVHYTHVVNGNVVDGHRVSVMKEM